MIRPVSAEDASAIVSIYNYYIQHTVITFEEEPLNCADMKKRIIETTGNYPWLVYELDGEIVGYAYAHLWRERASFRFSVEDSIYLKPGFEGRGIGSALCERLLGELRDSGIRAVVAGITVPNAASIALHEKFGFVQTGVFKEIGYKMDRWLDVGFWELLFPAQRQSQDSLV